MKNESDKIDKIDKFDKNDKNDNGFSPKNLKKNIFNNMNNEKKYNSTWRSFYTGESKNKGKENQNYFYCFSFYF